SWNQHLVTSPERKATGRNTADTSTPPFAFRAQRGHESRLKPGDGPGAGLDQRGKRSAIEGALPYLVNVPVVKLRRAEIAGRPVDQIHHHDGILREAAAQFDLEMRIGFVGLSD